MTIRVAARAFLQNKQSDSGLVGQIFREDGQKDITYIDDITVPIVDYASDYTRPIDKLKELATGNYFLQLSLPSGDLLTQKFSIEPDKDTCIVVDIPHEGPHEWTSLQALTGQFRHEFLQTFGFTLPSADPSNDYAALCQDPQNGYALSYLAPEDTAGDTILSGDKTLQKLAELIRSGLDVRAAQNALGNRIDIPQPTLEDPHFALFRFAHSGFLAHGQHDDKSYMFGPGSDLSRHYLLQESRQGATLISMPTAWTTPHGQAEVELLIKKDTIFAHEPDYSITIDDPMINTVLGYINIGAIHKAVQLVDLSHAESMLYDKISYPLTAAVGGYLLVLGLDRKGYRAASKRWQDWVENLDHWFSWLPDGAVLHAALHFLLGGPKRDEAYDALMRAYDRGLPFFTFGLKLMMDGMRYFSTAGDTDAGKRLAVLKDIAAHTDPSQMFLAVTFSERW